jgi:arylformamidase
MRIYDISRPVTPATAVWPGDQAVEFTTTARIGEEGSAVNLNAITQSLHAGTHADAPYHYLSDGATIDEVPLGHFVGPCLVVAVEHDVGAITPAVLERQLPAADVPPRVLFQTRHSQVPATRFDSNYVYFEPDAIDVLAQRGVVLVGTDAPSMDPYTSTSLPAHHSLGRNGMANLENLALDRIPVGSYQLVAVPLKLIGVDGAPVRAILLTNEKQDEQAG